MKRTPVSTALPGALAVLLVLGATDARARPPATPAQALEVEQAEAYAADAYEAYQRKDYATAVALYRKAYEAAPTADILFNIARIYDIGLGDRSLAMLFYQDYVVDPEAEDDRIEVAFERIGQLQAAERAAHEPRPSPPPTPAASSSLPPAAPTPQRASAEVEVIEPSAPWTSLRVGGIVAGTVGLVSIGSGAGFGVAALSDASTAREYCDGDVCSSQRGVDAVHSATKSADIATVSFALGGALVAAGGLLLWLDDGPPAHADSAKLEWTPIASESELGVALSGKW